MMRAGEGLAGPCTALVPVFVPGPSYPVLGGSCPYMVQTVHSG